VDASTISKSLVQGKDFRFEIPNESVSIWPDEELWRHAFYDKEEMYGGLAEAVTRWPRLARLYLALSRLDRPTLDALLKASSLKELYDQNVDLLVHYSAAFSVQEGRAVVPGGDAAEPLWSDLVGASPREPAAFFRALLRVLRHPGAARSAAAAFLYVDRLADQPVLPAIQRLCRRTEDRTRNA
jgi:hypothetical protein